jgi:hypothetical protein
MKKKNDGPRDPATYRGARRNEARADRSLRYWRLRRRTVETRAKTEFVSRRDLHSW